MLARAKRQVCIRRDDCDFVVAIQPDDVVIYRHSTARALRKLCGQLRLEVVADVLPELNDPATW
jgi:hypothetical protein